MKSTLVILTVLSLLLYLSPIDTIADKYYLLHYRFFELTIGGLIALKTYRGSSLLSYASFLGILLMIFLGAFTIGERAMTYNLVGGTNTIRESFLPRELILILTVLFTTLFIFCNKQKTRISSVAQNSIILAPLGRMSLSVFLWHQPLLAFYRYFYADELYFSVLLAIIAITLSLSFFTYHIIEKKIHPNIISRCCLLLSFIAINAFSLWIYSIGGAVRDVPELDIRKGCADPKVFERYTDRIYDYDKEFSSDSTKKRILVIGNSFARDCANILLESSFADSIQLSYHYDFENCPLSRICQCDRIYFFGWKRKVPETVWQNLRPQTEIWGIGTKNHGTSNGIFYKNRHREDYYAQRTSINPDYFAVNRLFREEWQTQHVDLLSYTLQSDSTVPVFTSNNHFITYDGSHLTSYGTRFYASLINFGLYYCFYLCFFSILFGIIKKSSYICRHEENSIYNWRLVSTQWNGAGDELQGQLSCRTYGLADVCGIDGTSRFTILL